MVRNAWLAAALAISTSAGAAEPELKLQLVTPKGDAIMATGLNAKGDVIGFEWVEEPDKKGVVSQSPFFARGTKMTTLPILAGYTATHPAGVSDAALVVGRSSKPAPPNKVVHLRNQAFIWDEKNGIRGLGALPDDSASYACGITRDGKRISGVTVGPNRVRACVWDLVGGAWVGSVPPQSGTLGSQVVVMSDDGRRLASIDADVPCLWSVNDFGKWNREVLGVPGSFAPRGVNNAGMVVGLTHTHDGKTHAMTWTHGKGLARLQMPKDYVRSEALAINNAGVVVGMMDGPGDSERGPRAFVSIEGRVRAIDEGGPFFTSATAINDAGQVAGVVDKEDAKGDDRH